MYITELDTIKKIMIKTKKHVARSFKIKILPEGLKTICTICKKIQISPCINVHMDSNIPETLPYLHFVASQYLLPCNYF